MNRTHVLTRKIFGSIKESTKNEFLNRKRRIKKIHSSLVKTLDILEDEKSYNRRSRLYDLEENFKENKIDYFHIKSKEEISDILTNFLSQKNESEILIEFNEGLLQNNLYGTLDTTPFSYKVAHPKFIWTRFNQDTIQKKMNEIISNESGEKHYQEDYYSYLKQISLFSSTGITAVDFIASDTGTLILLDKTNERGILCSTPEKHLVIANIYQTMKYYNILKLFGSFKGLSNNFLDVNMHIISNPSRTGDIEKILVYGAHGPLSLGVVIIDNSLNKINGDLLSEYMVYPLTLALDIIFPEFKHLAFQLGFSSINPHRIIEFLSSYNSRNVYLLLQIIINSIHHFEFQFPDKYLKTLNLVKKHALHEGEITGEEEVALSNESINIINELII